MKTINYKGDEYPYGSPTYENLSKLKVGQKFVSNNRCYPQEKDIAHYFENGTVHGFKPDIDPKIMEDYKLVGRANGCWTSSRQLGKIVMEGYEHQQDKSNQYMLIREKVSDSNLAAYCKANSADSLCQVKEPTEPVEESLEPTVSVVPVEPINCQDNPDDPMCASAKASEEDKEDEEDEEVTQKSLIEGMPNQTLGIIVVGAIILLLIIALLK